MLEFAGVGGLKLNIILGHSQSIGTYGILQKFALHKLWPFQNGMFSITEIGKNRKKSKISNKRNTVGDFKKVTNCDDTL